ncbi:hypothetical protein ANCCAN_07292 [Ancylostoma caninum]|uniref:Uncharacterized protein n=1 Tax=Ancylostoma caninum TaxID=29170 RepID=A0A368GQL3_ANCCA|nr:hypothetical protein ANCCAN_07292 [Ancylostoma caninum]
MGVYKYGFILTAVHDLVTSLCVVLSIPHSVNTVAAILVADGMLMMLVFFIIGSYCTWGIRSMLKNTSLSNNVKKAHRKMLRILLVQCACPTFLLYTPTSVSYVLLFVPITPPYFITDALGIILMLYPLFNPLVTIFCVKDYRIFIIKGLRMKKLTPSGHPVGLADRNVFVSLRTTT